jgi:hypothetical protein
MNQPAYDPHNHSADAHSGSPHPLSTLQAELACGGKDDEYGDRR